MLIFAADDEKIMLDALERSILEAIPKVEVMRFLKASDLLAVLENNKIKPDVVFLDIEMPGMNGLELAKRIKDYYSKTNIIFVTGFSEYSLEAFSLHLSGYVMKPVTAKKIAGEINHLRYPVQIKSSSRIRVQTFGNFEVFIDEKPLKFSRKRAKELFAYLVHKRGAACSLQEIAAILYEDEPYGIQQKNRLRQLSVSMIQAFRDVGMPDVILKKYNSLSIKPELIDCDYYRFRKMDVAAINAYNGEYMAQYEWAIFVVGYLDNQVL